MKYKWLIIFIVVLSVYSCITVNINNSEGDGEAKTEISGGGQDNDIASPETNQQESHEL